MAAREEPPDGRTKRGLPANYSGDDPYSCNAPTRSGRPCRALALESGRCKKHGGVGSRPRFPRKERRTRDQLINRVEEMLAKYRKPRRATRPAGGG